MTTNHLKNVKKAQSIEQYLSKMQHSQLERQEESQRISQQLSQKMY